MDSLGTAEAVVTVSKRVDPRAAAGFGMSWNRPADGTRWAMVSGFPHRGRLFADTKPSGRDHSGWARPEHGVDDHKMARQAWCGEHERGTGAAVGLPAPVPRSDVRLRDDILADRYDAMYRDGLLSWVREVA
jgi:hypothetical protein